MAVRLVEIFIPETQISRLRAIVERYCRRFWQETVPGNQEKFSCIVQQRYTGRLLDELEEAFGGMPTFMTYVSLLEATLPPIRETVETEIPGDTGARAPTALERFFTRERISTDELYDDIQESLHVTPSYLLMVILSAVIAALGMRSGQTAVVIGAMIIAPLLGPTIGGAMAATVGNARLGRQAATTLLVGSVTAILSGALVGYLVAIDPTVPELRNRAVVQPADIALALACGAAGVLAFSRGASLSLVGVMIAVALVPPLAATGIFLGQGLPLVAGNAFFLFSVNLVCVNVAGIIMFLIQGLPPKNWRLTAGMLAVWSALLILLGAMAAGKLVLGLGSIETVARMVAGGG